MLQALPQAALGAKELEQEEANVQMQASMNFEFRMRRVAHRMKNCCCLPVVHCCASGDGGVGGEPH